MATEQGEMVSGLKRVGFRLDTRKKKIFYSEGGKALEQIAQRCG